MGFAIKARMTWRQKDSPQIKEAIPLEKLFAGANTGTSTDDVKGAPGAAQFFDAVNGTKVLTLLCTNDIRIFFPMKRAIDFLVISLSDNQTGKVVNGTCKDLRVAKQEPFTVLQTVAGKKVSQGTRFTCVSLDFHDNDDGFVVEKV